LAGNDDEAQAALLQPEHFEPHVGKMFRFEGARHVLTLDRVLRETAAAGVRQPFTLIFHGPKERDPLPEGLYACQSEGGPRFELYVSPIHTPAPDRQDYQAVFN